MNLVIIDYNAGNTRSVIHALHRLGVDAVISSDKETILNADKVIFPGVGEAGFAMQSLKSRNLDKIIPDLKQPVLGICLGMQLMCRFSEESNTTCLGIFPMEVKRFHSEKEKIPHMGWNKTYDVVSPLFGSQCQEYYYFVHSYFVPVSEYTNSVCDYILPFSAGIQRENFFGVQFHPEKSDRAGAKVMEAFLKVK
jgi:glutamine amidotransferase